MSTTAASDYLELQLYNPSGAYVSSPFTIYGTGAATFSSSITATSATFDTLEVNSTTKGFLPPRMTTVQKNAITSLAAGMIVYDTTLNKLCIYTTAWETITSS